MKKNHRVIKGLCIPLLLVWIISCYQSKEERLFVESELKWRSERDQRMRSETSWLTIAGLFWLDEGENSFGTGTENNIILPENSSLPYAGEFIVHNNKVKIIANKTAHIQHKGKMIKEMVMQSDQNGEPDIIEMGDLKMWVIDRGERLAIRLRDLNSELYIKYKGLTYFPPNRKYRINGKLIPFQEAKTVTLQTVLGTETHMMSPGYVSFQLNGKNLRLDAFARSAESKRLFIIFNDETNGKETYLASRFMNCDVLENGDVDLNFNRAYNPPCAYTPYATCPLPPAQNGLPVRIEAGEKKYDDSH